MLAEAVDGAGVGVKRGRVVTIPQGSAAKIPARSDLERVGVHIEVVDLERVITDRDAHRRRPGLELAVDAERGRISFRPRQVDVADSEKPAEAHVRAGIEIGAEVPVERVVIDNAADVARAGGQAADENGARADVVRPLYAV
jgi:hypothetical protein